MAVKFAKHLIRRSGSSSDSASEGWAIYQERIRPPNTTILLSTGSNQATLDESYFIGWDQPNYHKRRKSGELMPMTPWKTFTLKGSSMGALDLHYSVTATENRYYTTGNYSPLTDWILSEGDLTSSIPEHYDEYVQEAASAIYSNGFDMLTFLAEIASVRRMFTGLVKSLIKMDIPDNIRKVSGSWLSTRYGWRTLMYDIKDINKAIINLKSGFDRYSEGRGGTSSNTVSDAWTTVHPNYSRQYTLDETITIGIRGHVVADLHVPRVQLNPLITGWELVPFSFVIDWFFSIGKSLAALSFLRAEMQYVASAGFEIEMTRNLSASIIPGSESSMCVSVADWQTASCVATLKVRSPCRVPLIPQYNLRLDSFKVIDLLGLLFQRLKPRR